jgi:hypothetical protein
VRVAIEAKALQDMGALAAGLDLLHRADPLAEVTLQPSGEHVLGAAGAAVCWPASGAAPTSVTPARASLWHPQGWAGQGVHRVCVVGHARLECAAVV